MANERNQKGFSLIELLVVVMIGLIVAAFAVPTFLTALRNFRLGGDSMSINGENVDGWMAAMTMIYPVDNADVFKTAKVGDSIEATVYQDDYTLYNVKVVAAKK